MCWISITCDAQLNSVAGCLEVANHLQHNILVLSYSFVKMIRSPQSAIIPLASLLKQPATALSN